MKPRFFLLAAACFSLASCAQYHIQPISRNNSAHWDKTGEGFVFYQSELYFLVTRQANDTNQWTVTPIYLPNPQKAYRLTTCNFLAKSDFAFNFKDGWQLSSIADKADNSTIANTLAGELKTLLSASGATLLAASGNEPQAFLLSPIYDGKGVITNMTPVTIPLK